MVHLTSIVVTCLLATIGAFAEDAPKKEKTLAKKDVSDLTAAASSYGLGYGASYPYYGYGGLGSLSHGLGSQSGYGGYGKAFIIPVFNYGQGGLGYGQYTQGGYPNYGYTGISLGGHSPYGSGYYSYPYGSSYYNGPHGLGGYYGDHY